MKQCLINYIFVQEHVLRSSLLRLDVVDDRAGSDLDGRDRALQVNLTPVGPGGAPVASVGAVLDRVLRVDLGDLDLTRQGVRLHLLDHRPGVTRRGQEDEGF